MTNPFVQAYHDYQVDLAELFGAEPERAATEMLEALNFEIQLANVKFLNFLQKKKQIRIT